VIGERDVLDDAAKHWWLFLLTGIAWFVFSLLVFQWNYTTVYAVSYLFGVVAIVAGVNEFLQIAVSTPGWKIVRGILGVLFVIAGIAAVVHPRSAFETIAALIGFFFLFKGIFDFATAFLTRSELELWWVSSSSASSRSCSPSGSQAIFRERTILLVVYVGVIALTRGVTELIIAFKLRGQRPRPA
jgi:uncharacterized membrane protein HdeD (DUF308 family)